MIQNLGHLTVAVAFFLYKMAVFAQPWELFNHHNINVYNCIIILMIVMVSSTCNDIDSALNIKLGRTYPVDHIIMVN